ncbi:hypothetical protein CFT12S00416_07990 [Campylobacter fetus subsp. testudinum]|uniref:hypothetical protein n=1 Tax=Campylobacter fetus TaxID=196 RepID=UPI0008188FA1|nr:hypothetical protein [Campylobacter fetus]OCR87756.1 hypothetical protein CFT12S00416_07990 [Campylobacter fetus subsp. testudinum]OCR99081.1 hypothetical protein A9K75_08530 [Campylobacter fetus subsp. testudinum]
MATVCPLCGKGTLKQSEKMVYCTNYTPKKLGNEWVNTGQCDFHIAFNFKAFGKILTKEDVRELINGKKIENEKGDKASLNINTKDAHYVKIEWKTRENQEF